MPTQLQNLLKKYDVSITLNEAERYINEIDDSQKYFPQEEQQAFIVKLLKSWEQRGKEKILILTSQFTPQNAYPVAFVFGIISSDWPGLSDSCIGVIHEKGWNIYFAIGLTVTHCDEKLGVILIGMLLEDRHVFEHLQKQMKAIIADIKKASVGSKTKMYLLAEEIKKLQIYSSVIDKIEEMYQESDIDRLISVDSEAVKFFSARSRDYIENRYTEDIAAQIILNYKLQEQVRRGKGRPMQIIIKNFSTKKEGIFTGITIAGRANQVLLDDCLKSIETCCQGFHMMHHKAFTSDDGITVHRFEILTADSESLTPTQIELLEEIFKNMEITKQRERQDWLESIGGFEHYARAIIPFLVRENESSGRTQVYLSVNQTTEKVIDFKILIVLTAKEISTKKLIYQCVNNLDSIAGFSISSVKPPKIYGSSEYTIIDVRVELSVNPEIDVVYAKVKNAIKKSIGDFRDFDEGMRQMDMMNFINVRESMPNVNEDFVREFYYSLEDFYRISAPVEEIGLELKLCMEVLDTIVIESKDIILRSKNAPLKGLKTSLLPATVMIIAYPAEFEILGQILNLIEKYEVIMSKLYKKSHNILICHLTENSKALDETEIRTLTHAIISLK